MTEYIWYENGKRYVSNSKPWNPILSEWAQNIRDEIRGTQSGVFYAAGICQGCGDMVDKTGKHSSIRNSCRGLVIK